MWMILAGLACSEPTPKTGPSVVMVLIDTQRADTMRYAGHERETTPHLDALAAQGAWFSRAYAASSWTLPSTATLLTGEHPWQHRAVVDVLTKNRYGVLGGRSTTLAERYRDRGYRTGAWMNNTFLAPEFGLDQGFEVYDYLGADPAVGHRSAHDTVDLALDWIDAGGEQPFFALIHVMEPHYNYRPMESCRRFTTDLPQILPVPLPAEIFTRWMHREGEVTDAEIDYIRRVYDEDTCTADDAMGRLFAGLKSRGLWDTAWIVVTSDHGEEFWDDGQYGHGQHLQSVLTQVPLIIRGPGVTPGRNDSVVGHVDLAELLISGEGDLARMLETGETIRGRHAASSNPNRAMDQLTVIGDDRRITLMTESRAAILHAVDPSGAEGDVIKTYNHRVAVEASPEYALLQTFHDDPLEPTLPSMFNRADDIDAEKWKQLRALGYVE